jgi:hypothetical protein
MSALLSVGMHTCHWPAANMPCCRGGVTALPQQNTSVLEKKPSGVRQ